MSIINPDERGKEKGLFPNAKWKETMHATLRGTNEKPGTHKYLTQTVEGVLIGVPE